MCSGWPAKALRAGYSLAFVELPPVPPGGTHPPPHSIIAPTPGIYPSRVRAPAASLLAPITRRVSPQRVCIPPQGCRSGAMALHLAPGKVSERRQALLLQRQPMTSSVSVEHRAAMDDGSPRANAYILCTCLKCNTSQGV